MGVVGNWLLHLSWADFAVGAVSGVAAAGLLVTLTRYLRSRSGGHDDEFARAAVAERQQLLLYCGDVKALADLAIQRHMSDAAFFQRLQDQPGFGMLAPYLSNSFRERLTQNLRHDGHADLAAACHVECERLDQLWRIPET